MYYVVIQIIDVVRLSWDDWNIEQIRRRGVTQEDMEHACHSEPVLFKQSYKDRLAILGPDENDRVLAVVIGQVPFGPAGVFYVFTARPADRSERRFYHRQKRGNMNE
jgi:uncharacterized DUF497 family protein